jgi:hypothetical protein
MAFKRDDIISFFAFTRELRAWTKDLGRDLGVDEVEFDWGDNAVTINFAVRGREPVAFKCVAEDMVNRERFQERFFAVIDEILAAKIGS